MRAAWDARQAGYQSRSANGDCWAAMPPGRGPRGSVRCTPKRWPCEVPRLLRGGQTAAMRGKLNRGQVCIILG